MNCVITAGPTYEPMDKVRRLTNFSTGRLGSELGNYLVGRGHEVTLLIGSQATYCGEKHARATIRFTTTANLRESLQRLADRPIDAVFHAAAVSDFAIGKIWSRSATGDLVEINSAKISTRDGTLLAELTPTPKIIRELRDWFPRARLVGWKYEMEGDRATAVARAEAQMTESNTDACVANGAAYGLGFGLVTGPGACAHFRDAPALYAALDQYIAT